MGLRINQNIAAMNSYRNLSNTDNQLSKSLEKLSSGFRINRAADDAAGLAISEGLRSQVGGLKVAVRNSQDGISVVQTAEGALNESHSILQRMRDLSVQASNTGGLNEDAKGAIQSEVDQLAKELTRIADTTKFNGRSLLDGKYEGQFQVGANVGENISVKVDQGMSATALGVDKVALSGTTSMTGFASVDGVTAVAATKGTITSNEGAFAATTVAQASFTGTVTVGDVSVDLAEFTFDTADTDVQKAADFEAFLEGKGFDTSTSVTAGGAISIVGADGASATYTPAAGGSNNLTTPVATNGTAAVEAVLGSFSGKLDLSNVAGTITVGNKTLDLATIDLSAATTDALKADAVEAQLDATFGAQATVGDDGTVAFKQTTGADAAISYTGVADSDAAIKSIDAAIKMVSTTRADLGALQNRFEHTINNTNVTIENLSASESRIRDADMAQEMMQFTRNQILAQAGTSMLAQANQGSQGVLSLLR